MSNFINGKEPQSDSSAYDGTLIVKHTTFGKSNRKNAKLEEVDRVKRAIEILNKEMEFLNTTKEIDLIAISDYDLKVQILANRKAIDKVSKVNNLLKTFVANNSQAIDKE